MLIHIYLLCRTINFLKKVVQMEAQVAHFVEHMWKRKKEQSIFEASRMRDHMTWSRIYLKEFQKHLKHVSICLGQEATLGYHLVAPFLTNLLECRVYYLLFNPLGPMCFFLETIKPLYIRGALLHLKGFIILEFIYTFVFNLCESIVLWQ